jgi:hypothetical protein
MRVCFGLAAAAVLALASFTQAAPFDAKEVSADVKWAAHLDVDALLASSLAKTAREQILKENPKIEAQLAAARNLFRFDPLADLHGVTVYGTQLKEGTGVCVIHAKIDQKLIIDLVKTNADYESTAYGKYELHSWKKPGSSKYDVGAFFKPDVIVLAASLDELKAALDVLDGTKPNISADYASLASAIPPGTYLIAGAKDLAAAKLHPEFPVFRQVDSVLLAAGENQGQVFAGAALTMKDAETAKNVKAVLDGGAAFATLVKGDDAEVMKLVHAVKATLTDKTIHIEAQAPADLVWQFLQKSINAQKAAHLHSILKKHHGISR